MSKLLINENPIMIQPSLVMKLGLNQAIIIQQVHYWLVTSSHLKDGKRWIFNTYKDWQKQFPFWSERTIMRAFNALEEAGYLISGNYNRMKLDKTKWYTIDYDKLAELEGDLLSHSNEQADSTEPSECQLEDDSLTVPIPEINTETNTERKNIPLPIEEIITYLNTKTDSNYKSSSKKTRELVKTRFNEGFRLEDFMKVIDIKTAEWLNDPIWCRYLRPETLFGTKFESYLNQKIGKKKKFYTEEDFNLDD
jgi:uncharacterized phage protein (TIGR02220 family)